jgi:hypothetical protein
MMRLALGLSLIAASCSRCGTAPERPLAERVATAVRAELPSASVTIADPSSLTVTLDGGGTLDMSLDNLRMLCAQTPERCDGLTSQVARNARQSIEAQSAKPTRTQVRAVLKNDAWVAQVAETMKKAPAKTAENALVTRPFLFDLTVVYVLDRENGIEMMNRGAQQSLLLDEAATDALALENLAAALPPPTLQPFDDVPNVFFIDEGEDYATSQLLLPHRFAPLAKELGGTLIVAAPVRNVLLVAPGSQAAARSALKRAATELVKRGPYALSDALLEWTSKGFTLVK